MILAAQVTEIVAQAVGATVVTTAGYFPRDQPQVLVAPDVQTHAGSSGWKQEREVIFSGNPPELRGGSDVVLACQGREISSVTYAWEIAMRCGSKC